MNRVEIVDQLECSIKIKPSKNILFAICDIIRDMIKDMIN